jgi:hypothetical protein
MAPENTPLPPAKGAPGAPHGHTGPTTPAEQSAREAPPEVVPAEDRTRIAEEASRQEDA